jgi:hypothetical protein
VFRPLLSVLLFALPVPALAQTSTATLVGAVRDPTGAILTSVTVAVTNTARNTVHTSLTNEVGSFVFPALTPGPYSVAAELPGFKRFVREGITLQVNQTTRVDIELELGAIAETVEVTAAVPMVESETSSRGSVIDERKIVELSA